MLVDAPTSCPAREKTGSTDFGNVMYDILGSCIRVAFVHEKAAAHSQEFLDAGKSESAHKAIIYAAKILAMTAGDSISDTAELDRIKKEFSEKKAEV